MILPKNPIITLNDGSDRLLFRAALLERVNDATAIGELDDKIATLTPEELATRNDLLLKKVSKTTIKFDEKLHPRNESGVFTKKSAPSKSGRSLGKVLEAVAPFAEETRGADIHDKVTVLGSKGFNKTLAGLSMGAINEIIAVPKDLPKVRLIESKDPLSGGTQGYYSPNANIIVIGKTSTIGSSTLIHELSHYLDQYMVGSDGKRLSDDNGILSAIKDSSEYKTLTDVKAKSTDKEQQGFVSYLLQPNEMFARAFAQWISTKSTNNTLKKEIKGVVDQFGPLQWGDESFKPISTAFDNLFKSKGLLRKKK